MYFGVGQPRHDAVTFTPAQLNVVTFDPIFMAASVAYSVSLR